MSGYPIMTYYYPIILNDIPIMSPARFIIRIVVATLDVIIGRATFGTI
jgi:hypothetical protein